jgi:hypothetical protein
MSKLGSRSIPERSNMIGVIPDPRIGPIWSHYWWRFEFRSWSKRRWFNRYRTRNLGQNNSRIERTKTCARPSASDIFCSGSQGTGLDKGSKPFSLFNVRKLRTGKSIAFSRHMSFQWAENSDIKRLWFCMKCDERVKQVECYWECNDE